jgi:glycosyltransferase involved in cell wall biosynthesis
MHILFVAISFPSPQVPHRSPFMGEQVRLLSEHPHVRRITVLSPTTWVPAFFRRTGLIRGPAMLPNGYRMREEGCEVLFPRYFKLPGDLLLRWTAAQWHRIVEESIAGFARSDPVSLVHANSGSVSSWAAVRAAQRYGIPCAVTYRGSDVHRTLERRRKGWQLCRDSFRFADLNLCVSRSLEATLRRHAQPAGRCEILLRGVDQKRFFPAEELTQRPNVLFVGRIEESKGVFDLLSAWRKVRAGHPGARLTLAGPDCTRGLFGRRRATDSRIDESVSLTGPLSLREVSELMRRSRVLCLPSHAEGTPNCVMEAMSCGIPVVATRVGGVPDIVEHLKTGLLVDRGDVAGLADALTALLSDPLTCARMGEAALAFAREHLDARRTGARLVQLYKELIEAHSRSEIAVCR